jgi:Xaa-Pro dipeptidase
MVHGITGLSEMPRLPDGIVPHGISLKLRHAFPHAELVNATFLMDEAKFVKSEEELAFLGRAVELVEGAIETMLQEARPGVPSRMHFCPRSANSSRAIFLPVKSRQSGEDTGAR